MSQVMDQRRGRHLALVGGLAMVCLVLASVVTLSQARRGWQPEVTGPVLAGWSDNAARAHHFEIHGAEGRFEVERDAGIWVMPSRDSHPVVADQLARLDAYLASLQYSGSLTADPDKHVRLGVADPGEAGGGTRVRISDVDGIVLADLLLGHSRDGRIYFRTPGDPRVYAARQRTAVVERPEIADASAWLDLDFLALGDNEIARATITPESGPEYVLERPARSTRNFALRQPRGWTPITSGAGNGPANTLSRVRFRDVRRAERLDGDIIARHSAETFAGLRVNIDVLALGETRWALIEAVALTDDVETEAAQINGDADGWAYLLSDLTIDRLLRPLNRIADRRVVEPAELPDNGEPR
ncbi:DUF4340 domain-containing protein [Maricaulis sp. CAU 1757]